MNHECTTYKINADVQVSIISETKYSKLMGYRVTLEAIEVKSGISGL